MQSNWQQSKLGASLFGARLPLRRVLNLAILAILHPAPLLANPNGAEIIHGQVSINTATPGVTNITNSPNAIIQWQNFNIAQNEITRFIQQNGQSAVLNRIIGENPSAILGQLVSNGKVFLINPNGIVFGAGATIDTQGFLASSLNLSDQDFLRGNYHFIAGSGTGNIVNEGIIRTGKDGNVILIAPSITNNGIIKSEGGQITLAAGQELTITNLDDPAIRFQIRAPENTILNLGKLLTEGGAVNVFANSITHSGEINADSVKVDAKGNINLIAEQDIKLSGNSKLSANNNQGDAGNIHIESKSGTTLAEGSIEAKATQNGHGGNVAVLGERVGILGQAQIDASGANGGGKILVGGDVQGKNADVHNAKATYVAKATQLNADAKNTGNGGKVVVWADQATRAYGQISAKGGAQGGDGGFVETSAHWLDTSGIKVDASAARGKGGQWLLDPNDITIQAKGTDTHASGDPNWTTENDSAIITTRSIESALNNGTSVRITTGTAGANSQEGNITVASAINKTSGGDAGLNLNAHNNININAPITATAGKLYLELTADWDHQNGGGTHINKAIDLHSGGLTLYGTTVISAAIQNASLTIPTLGNTTLNSGLSNVDAINIDSDASLTINWGNTHFTGQINNQGTLTINANFVTEGLSIEDGVLAGTGTVTVLDEFDFESGSLEGSGQLITATGSVTYLGLSGDTYLDKNWANSGTIYWDGIGDLGQKTDGKVTFTNALDGIIKISEPEIGTVGGSVRHLDMAVFNNKGKIEINGSTLQISGAGSDSGSYKVTGNGQLQFWDSIRTFTGATIDSSNPVKFVNGDNRFINGGDYKVSETIINGAKLAFSTGSAISLPNLTINQGTLGGSDAIEVSGLFNFHAGSLIGVNTFTTAKDSTTTLADLGPVSLNKRWDNFGTINWQGTNLTGESKSVFNNGKDGVFNIEGESIEDMLSINFSRFNNQGVVNLSNGTLKIFSPGTDTGSYNVAKSGQLQFWNGIRHFNNNAEINSPTIIQFVGGSNYFNNGSSYNAPKTLIDNATVAFNTGKTIDLDTLTIDNNAIVAGSDSIQIASAFNFYSGIVTGAGKVTTAVDSSTILTDGSALLNKLWDNYGVFNFSAAAIKSESQSFPKQRVFPVREWNNYGTINWLGAIVPANEFGSFVILNNKAGGIFNVSGNGTTSGFRELSLAAFNNQGTVNLTSGGLKILSGGTDSGVYNVTGNGQLQFLNGTRLFNKDSAINSSNTLAFIGGINNFAPGSSYAAPQTVIDGATVNFNNDAVLDNLYMTGGILSTKSSLSVNGAFNWYGGMLAGSGVFNFNDRFNYSTGIVAATGTIHINDHSGNLLLPAMPSITRISASTTGNLLLSGNITASGNGNAILLIADQTFDNSANASLSATNGHWLVYANNPASHILGGLAANFKHYGCAFLTGCNDGFTPLSTPGNGLLYRVTPTLTVTPNAVNSIYGDAVNFSAGYSGFIDGDTASSAGISGNATYSVGGAVSGSGHYNAGKHNVSYLGGLANALGYQFQDDSAALDEWVINPRALNVNADPANKIFGSLDPLLTYSVTGLLSGDGLTGTLSRVKGEDVGNYAINQGNLDAGNNYALNYTAANFKINPQTVQPPPDDDNTGVIQEEIGNQQNDELVLSQQLVLNKQLDGLTVNDKKGDAEPSSESKPESQKSKDKRLKQCK